MNRTAFGGRVSGRSGKRSGRSVAGLWLITLTVLTAPEPTTAQRFVTTRPVSEYVPTDKTLTPDEAVADFVLPDDLAIELVAAEPEITDPVAIAFDADGRLFVVEMGGYPNGPTEEGAPEQSRVRLLEDADGDGRYETSTIFADGLTFPTGVMPWDGGIYVTCAPYIYYFKDTNGDKRADVRRIVFEGFGEGNQQHRVNGLKWGLDNWVYVANGDSGGRITSPQVPGKHVSIRGSDFRFRPGTDEFEAISGQGQFGLAFDDFGRRFFCSNRRHVHEVVLPRRYLARNPHLAVRSPQADVSDHGDAPRVYPRSEQKARWIDITHVGYVTSACGLEVYRGSLLPIRYHGNVFVAEPVANLVHRDVLTGADQPVVTASRARPGVEFLTSSDPWCRPVFLANGPDGALYVVDMYRQHIEHPEWIAPELIEIFDLQAGRDRGRIYRILPKGMGYRRPLRLGQANTIELVRNLSAPDGWRRDTVHRRLVARRSFDAIGPLRSLALTGSLAQARLHALWILESLGGLDESLLVRLLVEAPPRIKEHAVRLSEPFLDASPILRRRVLGLADHSDARLRFQVALSLGEITREPIDAALSAIVAKDVDNPWTRLAVLSSAAGHEARLLVGPVMARKSPGAEALATAVGRIIGARQRDAEIADLLGMRAAPSGQEGSAEVWWKAAAVIALADGLGQGRARRLRFSATQPLVLRMLSNEEALDRISADPRFRNAIWRIASFIEMEETPEQKALIDDSMARATNPRAAVAARVAAIRHLAFGRLDAVGETLEALLSPREPRGVQSAAVSALARFDESEAADLLLANWSGLVPVAQKLALDVLLRRTEWVPRLLEAMDEGLIPAFAFDAIRRDRLLGHPDGAIRERAAALLAGTHAGRVEKRLEAFAPALTQPGNAEDGRRVFENRCATCHKVGDVGYVVGPDLTGVKARPRESLLADIVAPNRAVAPGYSTYTVQTVRGELLSGLLVSETANNITLAQADGVTSVILRSSIDAMASSTLSLMPEGLVQDLSVDDMANLLAFLKALPAARGPVAYWRMEHDGKDRAGAVADDAVIGAGRRHRPPYVDAVPGAWIRDPITGTTRQNAGAVRFDGKDDSLQLGQAASADLASPEIDNAQTIEMFVRLDGAMPQGDGGGLLIGQGDETAESEYGLVLLAHQDGSFELALEAHQSEYWQRIAGARGGTLGDRKWHHVAGVVQYEAPSQSVTLRIHQDYRLLETRTVRLGHRDWKRSVAPYHLGGQVSGDPRRRRFLEATMDEVRISNGALSPDRFLRIAQPEVHAIGDGNTN